jgi:primosomal protein N' (replication factor Y)
MESHAGERSAKSPYAEVLVDVEAPHLPQPFTYKIPEGMPLSIGDAILVPFGPSRELIGYVVGFASVCPPGLEGKIREIADHIAGANAFDEPLWHTARWVSEQTLCELRDALRLIAPELTTARLKTTVRLVDGWQDRVEGVRTVGALALIERLATASSRVMEEQALLKSVEDGQRSLSALRRRGVVALDRTVTTPQTRQKVVRLLRLIADADVALAEASRIESRAARQARILRELVQIESAAGSLPTTGVAVEAADSAAARALAEKGLASYREVAMRRDPFTLRGLARTAPPPLTDEQSVASRAIGEALSANTFKPFLLFGVTGSGKTEVYMDAIARVRAQGRSALVLLPEIGLAAQVLDLLKARFGDDVAVLHSALSVGERFDEWQRIRRGEARVVVGARSAVFAPVQNLGLVVVDEEHEGAYKQDSSPRYHARDVALFRARQTNAVIVMGSATPAVESYWRAKAGSYELLTLEKRVSERALPPVKLVDLRTRKTLTPGPSPAEGRGGAAILTLSSANEPVGLAPPSRVGKGDAGLGLSGEGPGVRANIGVLSEPLLTALSDRLIRREQAILFLNRRGFSPFLLCRDCGFSFRCPQCDVSLTYHQGPRLLQCHHCDYRRPIPAACPKCNGARLRPFGIGTEKVEDAVLEAFPQARTLRMDRDTTERKGAHAEILRAFRRGDADILIGTQMVAKGLDFAGVTLVGVINADTALNLPDFRAAERSFQLLTQVAGRAGRGERPGEVLVQTFDPENESIQQAAAHDYVRFYFQEIGQRRDLRYPPFASLANIVVSDEDENRAITSAEFVAQELLRVIAMEKDCGNAQVLGPVACPLGRLRGRYRWHVLFRCNEKPTLLALLRRALDAIPQSERRGLTLDIDPLSML